MENVKLILSDEQISDAWGNANFGRNLAKRDIIANALLKYASGYSTGHTINKICGELGLITKKGSLSVKGKQYLFAHYSSGVSV